MMSLPLLRRTFCRMVPTEDSSTARPAIELRSKTLRCTTKFRSCASNQNPFPQLSWNHELEMVTPSAWAYFPPPASQPGLKPSALLCETSTSSVSRGEPDRPSCPFSVTVLLLIVDSESP